MFSINIFIPLLIFNTKYMHVDFDDNDGCYHTTTHFCHAHTQTHTIIIIVIIILDVVVVVMLSYFPINNGKM
jgi:hypothetical protein